MKTIIFSLTLFFSAHQCWAQIQAQKPISHGLQIYIASSISADCAAKILELKTPGNEIYILFENEDIVTVCDANEKTLASAPIGMSEVIKKKISIGDVTKIYEYPTVNFSEKREWEEFFK